MKRRTFIGASASLLLPLSAPAQERDKVWRVGFFYFGSRQAAIETGRYAAFMRGMREAGYTEGKNFAIEARYADGNVERFPALAAELVHSKVDVIVSTSTQMHRAVQNATRSIPIVITVSPDPVKGGLAASFARPGGNITGLSTATEDLSYKHLEVLLDTVPSISRIGVLFTTANPTHRSRLDAVRTSAGKARVEVSAFNVATPHDIEASFAYLTRSRANAVIILTDSMFVDHARQVANVALKHRLPTIFGPSEFTEAGGLMSYGADIRDNYRRAAKYVDRILKGARPADLPIEQPSKLELVINLKTARAIGMEIPRAMLFRADRVIE